MVKLEHPSSGSVEALRPPLPLSLTGPPAVVRAVPLPLNFSLMAFTGLTVLFPIRLILVSRPLVPLTAHQCIDYKRRSVEPGIDLEVKVFERILQFVQAILHLLWQPAELFCLGLGLGHTVCLLHVEF
jgi:hypothetical protein